MPISKLTDYESKLGPTSSSDDESLDEILESIEDDEFLSKYREQRIEEIASHLRQVKENSKADEYGSLQTLQSERDAIQISTSTQRVVLHFFLDSFQKCTIMDAKLQILAKRYLRTRFLRINVESCPFLVQKLNIKVLPFTIAYVGGIERCRLIGFQELGNQPNDFPLPLLERKLVDSGVLTSVSHVYRSSALSGVRETTPGNDNDIDL